MLVQRLSDSRAKAALLISRRGSMLMRENGGWRAVEFHGAVSCALTRNVAVGTVKKSIDARSAT